MPEHDQELITFRSLYDSPMIGVRDYICRHTACGQSAEEQSVENGVVLMRHGAFSKHFGTRQVTADVNQAIFFSKDAVYRVSHPADCGDRGTSFVVAPRVLTDIVRELDASVDEHSENPFPFITGPCSAAIFWRHREFVRRLEIAGELPLEPLWADVTGLQLVADVLSEAFAASGSKPRRRPSTIEDHAARVEAAKTYLAVKIAEPVTLDDVAAAVHASPFNFARIFQQQTGLPIHRYLTVLRLRAALELIADARVDLTTVALELGFSSHSHFSDVFRREFGLTPSAVREKTSLTAIRQMSKDLIQPDIVKLDMGLVRGVETDGPRQSIVRAIWQVCIDLGIDFLVEGVETLDEFSWFTDLGAYLYQGYLFAKPMFEGMPVIEIPTLKTDNFVIAPFRTTPSVQSASDRHR